MGLNAGRCVLERRDLLFVLERQADIVQTLHQAPAGVIINLKRGNDRAAGYRAGFEVDRNLGSRVILDFLPNQLDVALCDLCGNKPCLPELPRKISANREERTALNP